jgi:hypothetical protein
MHENWNFSLYSCGGGEVLLDEMLDEYLGTKNDESSYLLYMDGWEKN